MATATLKNGRHKANGHTKTKTKSRPRLIEADCIEADRIECQTIVIRNQVGQGCIVLGTDHAGKPQISMYDTEDRKRINLGMHGDIAVVEVFSDDESTSIWLHADALHADAGVERATGVVCWHGDNALAMRANKKEGTIGCSDQKGHYVERFVWPFGPKPA